MEPQLTTGELALIGAALAHSPFARQRLRGLLAFEQEAVKAGLQGKWSVIAEVLMTLDMNKPAEALSEMTARLRR